MRKGVDERPQLAGADVAGACLQCLWVSLPTSGCESTCVTEMPATSASHADGRIGNPFLGRGFEQTLQSQKGSGQSQLGSLWVPVTLRVMRVAVIFN